MEPARLSRIVRQHAETSRLLGVDFVPAYRAKGSASAQLHEELPEARDHVSERVNDAEAKPAIHVEVKAPQSAPVPVPTMPHGARDPVETQRRLDALRARYEADAPHSKFVTAHTKIVFGDGDPVADLVFVGEAPGEEEDRRGIPFVGRSGELLNKMIAGMGLSRERVYICNVLKTRPPDNATPTAREIEICEPYLREQIGIIAPGVIVTLGLPAARALLHTMESMTRMRGRWRTYQTPDGRLVPLMPTYHPAYVLRNYTEETRRMVWSDLQQVMGKLRNPDADSGN